MKGDETRERVHDWFRKWHLPLRKFLNRSAVVPPGYLDDVAQEVFLRLLRYDRGELVAHPQAYVFKIASNVATEWAMRHRHSRPHDSKWLAALAMEDSSDEPSPQEMEDEIERALSTLTALHREVLKLQFRDGLSHSEIALRLGMTRRSVKRTIMKAYEKLRAELDPDRIVGGSPYGRC